MLTSHARGAAAEDKLLVVLIDAGSAEQEGVRSLLNTRQYADVPPVTIVSALRESLDQFNATVCPACRAALIACDAKQVVDVQEVAKMARCALILKCTLGVDAAHTCWNAGERRLIYRITYRT